MDEGSGKIHVEDLVKTRNRKLVELYCMSRLNELLEINNQRVLKGEIDNFLRQNDIGKGVRFNSDTLPKFTQVGPPAAPVAASTAPSTAGGALSSHGNSLPPKRALSSGRKKDTSSITSLDHLESPGLKTELKRPLTDTRSTDEPLEKKIKVERDIEPENKGSSASSSLQNSVSSINQSASIYTSPEPHVSNQPVYFRDIEVPAADPTPVEPVKRYSNYLVEESSKKAADSVDYFNENNINSKESVYLLMKEIVPSKVAQALPLAELKYMVQTLPLIKLIPMAHKALTTDIMNNALSEGRITVVSSRIEELRRLGLWSLRQPKKFQDAWQNDVSHHRTLIEEAKWMQADFKEGRKYRIAVCTTLAHAVMEYWAYGKICCIQTKPIEFLKTNNSESVKDDSSDAKPKEEDQKIVLDNKVLGESEKISDITQMDQSEQEVTGGIDLTLLLQRPNTAEEIVPPQLPETSAADYARYKQGSENQPFKLHLSFEELNSTVRTIAQDIPLYTGLPDESDEEKLSFVPVSKSLVTLEDDHFYKLVEKQIIDDEQSLVQLSKRRGMFYGNRRSHYLKPPPAPSLRYLQNRTPTIWLPEDDQELVKNINAYAYNWELISAHMTHRPTLSYFSNIERRTPWQCFERFVQLNERFSFSDLKGPRAHSVQMWLMEAHKFQQKQNRRISPLGVGPESIQRGHRRLRWASMFEAMRKCIKKRENAPRPNPTQPRKPLDCKNMKVPTPAEMSQLKAQRDESLRRDIQMRRNVKSRLQQQSNQTPPIMNQSHSTPKLGASGADQSPNSSSIPSSGQLTKTLTDRQTPTPAFPQKRLTEREIIESYSRRILAQKPELSMETAMKAAQSYYKTGQQRKMQLQQQQQQLQRKKAQSQSAPTLGQSEQMDQTAQRMSNTLLNTSNSAPTPKVDSPTPQEILDRLHK